MTVIPKYFMSHDASVVLIVLNHPFLRVLVLICFNISKKGWTEEFMLSGRSLIHTKKRVLTQSLQGHQITLSTTTTCVCPDS